MKYTKITLFVGLILSMTLIFGQSAKRYTLFEHFTQASCGPCAAQNPAFAAFFAINTRGIAPLSPMGWSKISGKSATVSAACLLLM